MTMTITAAALSVATTLLEDYGRSVDFTLTGSKRFRDSDPVRQTLTLDPVWLFPHNQPVARVANASTAAQTQDWSGFCTDANASSLEQGMKCQWGGIDLVVELFVEHIPGLWRLTLNGQNA